MKKLNTVEITAAEEAALQAGQSAAEAVWTRWRDANGGRWGEELSMNMVVAPCTERTPHAWWEVHPQTDHMRNGHCMSLARALAEMHAKGTAELKKRQAEQYRIAAERLEQEAQECATEP